MNAQVKRAVGAEARGASNNHAGPGFIKLMRAPESEELLRDPLAFALLARIAWRARWRTPFNIDDLELWEARIGDHDNCGMTRQQYRSRLRRLQKWNLITTRTTYRGTVARLSGNGIFDIGVPSEQAENGQKSQPAVGSEQAKNSPTNQPADSRGKTTVQQPPSQPTANQQPTSQQPLTKKEIMEERKNHDDEVAANPSSFTIPEEAKQHPLWPEFASWCRSKNGRPLVAGFNTWLRKQPSLPEKKSPRTNGSNYQRLLDESQARADAEMA